MLEIKIGLVLKRLIREHRTDLKTISRETGIPYSTLYTWSENRQPKNILKAQELAQHFGITLHELLFDLKDQREKADEPGPKSTEKDDFFKGKFEIVIRRLD